MTNPDYRDGENLVAEGSLERATTGSDAGLVFQPGQIWNTSDRVYGRSDPAGRCQIGKFWPGLMP